MFLSIVIQFEHTLDCFPRFRSSLWFYTFCFSSDTYSRTLHIANSHKTFSVLFSYKLEGILKMQESRCYLCPSDDYTTQGLKSWPWHFTSHFSLEIRSSSLSVLSTLVNLCRPFSRKSSSVDFPKLCLYLIIVMTLLQAAAELRGTRRTPRRKVQRKEL